MKGINMISGGNHLEYPIELKGDIEMESEHEYEEWLWEQDKKQGPPQDDDIVWLKKAVVQTTGQTAGVVINTPYVDEEHANIVGQAAAEALWEIVGTL